VRRAKLTPRNVAHEEIKEGRAPSGESADVEIR
jgi:hypothetical protein